MSEKILFVDDEPAVLDGYRRLLGRELALDTAVGSELGLAAIAQSGPYGVVVSDMRMPQMDGAQFLAEVRKLAPSTVRMALTGYADIDTAMYAVNEGHIFRFLTKPCSRENLLKSVESAFDQHHLILAEQELLEGTLRGCVHVLSEMLSFSNPAAFGRAMRLRRFVQHAVDRLRLEPAWSFEIAAMLSQVGCVTLTQDLVNAAYTGQLLSPEDQARYDRHPAMAGQMLARIPRMEPIAQMIAHQNTAASDIAAGTLEEKRQIKLGAQMLRVGLAYDGLLSTGRSAEQARRRVRSMLHDVDPDILDSLDEFETDVTMCTRECRIHDLAIGMILEQDLYTTAGLLIVAKGQELSYQWVERLREYWRRDAIPGRILVQVARSD